MNPLLGRPDSPPVVLLDSSTHDKGTILTIHGMCNSLSLIRLTLSVFSVKALYARPYQIRPFLKYRILV